MRVSLEETRDWRQETAVRMDSPYLLFLGDETDPLLAKTACGVVDWARELCLGQLRLSKTAVDLGLPDMTVKEAFAGGARTLVVGIANPGGAWGDSWRAVFGAALEAGLDIASGLHERLAADDELRRSAQALGRRLIDLRDPPENLQIGSGRPRSGRRVLTVGADCAVGKKYTALALWRSLREQGAAADF